MGTRNLSAVNHQSGAWLSQILITAHSIEHHLQFWMQKIRLKRKEIKQWDAERGYRRVPDLGEDGGQRLYKDHQNPNSLLKATWQFYPWRTRRRDPLSGWEGHAPGNSFKIDGNYVNLFSFCLWFFFQRDAMAKKRKRMLTSFFFFQFFFSPFSASI